jgi:hypothetical protein
VSGSFSSIPGTSVAANYTVNSAIAGQPIVGGISGASTISVNLIEDHQRRPDVRQHLQQPLGDSDRPHGPVRHPVGVLV